MTPVGKIIRRFSSDELPQIFNVLAGQISFIGPRPLGLDLKIILKSFDIALGHRGINKHKD